MNNGNNDRSGRWWAIRCDSDLAAAIDLEWNLGHLICHLRLIRHSTRTNDWYAMVQGMERQTFVDAVAEISHLPADTVSKFCVVCYSSRRHVEPKSTTAQSR